MAARCWRGPGGEIDLIFRKARAVTFVEVKRARTHALAAERVSARQQARIMARASAFLAGEPSGQDTETAFEVALVDAQGRIEIVSNAFV